MSSSKKRQTMAKIARERAVKERRARKQDKKDERKQAALDARAAADGVPQDTEVDETPETEESASAGSDEFVRPGREPGAAAG